MSSPKRKSPDRNVLLVSSTSKKLRRSDESTATTKDGPYLIYSTLLHLITPNAYPKADTWLDNMNKWQRRIIVDEHVPAWQRFYSAFVEQRAAFSNWWATHRATRFPGDKCPIGLPFLGIILSRDPHTVTRVVTDNGETTLQWRDQASEQWYRLDSTSDCRPIPLSTESKNAESVSEWFIRTLVPSYRATAVKRIMDKYARWVTERVNWPPILRTQLIRDWERLTWLDYGTLIERSSNFEVWSWVTVGWLRSWLYPSLDVSETITSDQSTAAYRFLLSLNDTLQRLSVGSSVSGPARNRMAGVNIILDAYETPSLFMPFACAPITILPSSPSLSSCPRLNSKGDGDQTERLIEAFSRVEISPEVLPSGATAIRVPSIDSSICPRCVGVILPIMPLITSGGRRYWLVHMTALQVAGSSEMQEAVRNFYRRPIDMTMRRFLEERLLGEHDTARSRVASAQTVRDLGMKGTEFAGFVRQAFFVPILGAPYEPRALFDDILLPVEIWNPRISSSSSSPISTLSLQMDLEDLIGRALPSAEELRKDALIRTVLSSLDVSALAETIGPTQTLLRLEGHLSLMREYSIVLHAMEPGRFAAPQGFYEQWLVFVERVIVPIWNAARHDPLQWTVWLHRYLLRRLGKTYQRDSYLEGFLALDAETLTCSCFCGSVLMALASDALGFYGSMTMNWLMSQHIFFGTETLGWETTVPDLCELRWEPVTQIFDRMNSLPVDTSVSFVVQPIRSVIVLLHHVVTQWMNDRIAYRLGPGPSEIQVVLMPELLIDPRVVGWWRDRQPVVSGEQPPRMRWLDAYVSILLDLLDGRTPEAAERFLEAAKIESQLELSLNASQLNLQAFLLLRSMDALRQSIVELIRQGDAQVRRLREQWPAKWAVATQQGSVEKYEEWRQRVRSIYMV